jgi:hypothetical protein
MARFELKEGSRTLEVYEADVIRMEPPWTTPTAIFYSDQESSQETARIQLKPGQTIKF